MCLIMGDWVESIVAEYRIIAESVILTLVILKLTGEISLSWWWVFSPMAISILIFIVIVISVIIISRNGTRGKKKAL